MCTFVNANAPCPEGVSDSLTTYPHSVLTVGPSSIPLWPARTPLKTIIGGFPGGPVVKTSEPHGFFKIFVCLAVLSFSCWNVGLVAG